MSIFIAARSSYMANKCISFSGIWDGCWIQYEMVNHEHVASIFIVGQFNILPLKIDTSSYNNFLTITKARLSLEKTP